MYTSTAVEILISCPSDVHDARDAIQVEIGLWNAANARRRGVTAVAVHWETDAVPEMGAHPQAILNRQLVDRCDLLVALFRSRLGTPTPTAPSGTAEEIDRFIAAKRSVLLYRLQDDGNGIDVEQRSRLDEFIASRRAVGLIWEVPNVDRLRTEFRRHVSAVLAAFEDDARQPPPPLKLSDDELGLLEHLGGAGRTFVEELSDASGVGAQRLIYHFERMESAGLVDQIDNAVAGPSFTLTKRGRAELFARGVLR